MNHFANGAFHCNTFVHGLNQTSSCFAWRAQNFSGDRIDSLYIVRYSAMDLMWAARAKSFGGGKTRSSCRADVMLTGLVLSIQTRGVSVSGAGEGWKGSNTKPRASSSRQILKAILRF